jgi:polyhydroxyalkanoate synthase
MAGTTSPDNSQTSVQGPYLAGLTKRQSAEHGAGNGQDQQWPLAWLNDATVQYWRTWSSFVGASLGERVKEQGPPGHGAQLPTSDSLDEQEAIMGGATASIDRLFHAWLGQVTLGLSPAALCLAYADWAIHLLGAPGKRQQLAAQAWRKAIRFSTFVSQTLENPNSSLCIEPLAQDSRFRGAEWQLLPYRFIYQAFLLQQQWWHSATTGVRGVSTHHEAVVAFVTRQLLDIVSPVNFLATNPEVLAATWNEGGRNFVRGSINLWADWERAMGGKQPIGSEAFEPGKEVAVTPGEVVFRNPLFELIQYKPTTKEVHAEPVLIVPAWIMKYYILDLSPTNSLVKYLVGNGHTVFMMSWRNPTAEDRNLGLNDYLRLGVIEALKAVRSIVPGAKVNSVGYCLGGTLLAIAAAYLARERQGLLNSVTLFAAQTDFTEAGELTLFIDDSQLSYLEDIMWDQGYLDTRQMAGAFQLLRSNDLIWSRVVNEYLLGRRPAMFDLMAWNADTTRMPYRMHSEYLRELFLHNDLFEGRYKVDGRPVFLGDIDVPLFVVATERDHVAPWRSVYKINLVEETNVTFVLTSGGHNAGIVSEPGHKGRQFRILSRQTGSPHIDPDSWHARAEVKDGSWWPAWIEWLDAHSMKSVTPPSLGSPQKDYPLLEHAPGRYVLEH